MLYSGCNQEARIFHSLISETEGSHGQVQVLHLCAGHADTGIVEGIAHARDLGIRNPHACG